MSPTSLKRWRVLIPLLALAGWLAFFGDKTPSDAGVVGVTARVDVQTKSAQVAGANQASPLQVEVVPRSDSKKSSPPAIAALDMLVPRAILIPTRDASTKRGQDLFVAGSWLPPQSRAINTTELAPAPPPIPFLYLGKKFDGTSWEVFLGRGDRSFVVAEGTVIEGTYRIDTISPPTLTLTYMPLKQSQSLAIGDSL